LATRRGPYESPRHRRRVAPLRRSSGGSITPILVWLHMPGHQQLTSVSIVGSASPEYGDPPTAGTDLDVVVLCDDLRDGSSFVDTVQDALDSLSDPVSIVSGWGVVSPAELRIKVVHLLLDTPAHYQARSSLFRRSVGKYSPIVGRPLCTYSPDQRYPGFEELVSARDGPVRLGAGLLQRSWTIDSWKDSNGTWVLVSEPNNAAGLIDHVLYAALHSARNFLRCLGRYQELRNTASLLEGWELNGGPNLSGLRRLVSAKCARKRGSLLLNDNVEGLVNDTLRLLEEGLEWCSKRTNER